MASAEAPPAPNAAKTTGDRPCVNDVSRMNCTEVDRICQPRCVEDVIRMVLEARELGRKVAMRGTKHSMGGQSVPSIPHGARSEKFGPPRRAAGCGDYVLDFARLNHVTYDQGTGLVTCGPGATWADLIQHLNDFGKAPVTMQSYATFSVGGTLAVNGHGITTDDCVSESVVSFRLIKADGTEVTCSRKENVDLWELAIGGYGMFGIIVEITMKTKDNVLMDVESIQCDSAEEFHQIYSEVLKDEAQDIEVKIARLNIMDLEQVDLFIYRRDAPMRSVSRLDRKPAEMSWKEKILYKWVMPTMREERGQFERATGAAIDMPRGKCERNQLLYVSAESLAQLWSPLLKVDDTFVLQEYFVPHGKFLEWIRLAKPIYKKVAQDSQVILLNTTIRYCRRQTDQAFLSYTRRTESVGGNPILDGVYAFVLYYRLPRTSEADGQLQSIGNEFIKATLEVGGSFYLPYRLHYSSEDMEKAYPNIRAFCEHKQTHDPDGLFDSAWFQAYGLGFCSSDYCSKFVMARSSDHLAWQVLKTSSGVSPDIALRPVLTNRSGFYRRLVSSHKRRKEVFEAFLVQIFMLKDPAELHRYITKAVWRTLAEDNTCPDIKVYKKIQEQLSVQGPLSQLSTKYKSLKQLSSQKIELTRETVASLRGIGRTGGQNGRLKDYVSIGDNGKLALPLREALDLQGRLWIVNDPAFSENLEAVLERGTHQGVGTYLQYDLYREPEDVGEEGMRIKLDSDSADLVTMNQGLHHIRPKKLPYFLREVHRILRPGGVFIVREHDASEELMDMLDLAHSIFNAVTEVSPEEEECECRAFRPILEWRQVVEQFGFVDSMLYEMEHGDPTIDEMMCFIKPFTVGPTRPRDDEFQDALEAQVYYDAKEEVLPGSVQIPATYLGAANQLPVLVLTLLKNALSTLKNNALPTIRSYFEKNLAASMTETMRDRIRAEMKTYLDPLEKVAGSFLQFLEKAQLMNFDSSHFPLQSHLPQEMFLIYPTLQAKSHQGTITADEQGILNALETLVSWAGGGKKEGDETIQPRSNRRAGRDDIFQLFRRCVAASGDLRDPEHCFQHKFGFKPIQLRLLSDALAGFARLCHEAGRDEAMSAEAALVVDGFADMLDPVAWEHIKTAFEEELGRRQELPPLTKDAVMGLSPEGTRNVWYRAAMAYFGSPNVVLAGKQVWGANLADMGDFVQLYRAAKKVRQSVEVRQLDATAKHDGMVTHAAGEWMKVEEAKMWVDDLCDVEDVGEVISVEILHAHERVGKIFGKGPRQVDRDLLAFVQRFLTQGRLSWRGRKVPDELIAAAGTEPPATAAGAESEEIAHNVRKLLSRGGNRVGGKFGGAIGNLIGTGIGSAAVVTGGVISGVSQIGTGIKDSSHMVVNATAGAIGRPPQLVITYRRRTSEVRLTRLLEALRKAERLEARSAEGRAYAAPFTWYKLSEWMQVEIMQQLGNSMETSPWFRFPFLKVMLTYGNVLMKEANVVLEKHGLQAAFASEGFLTSLVPGIVMAMGFMVLEGMAFPLKFTLGDSYVEDRKLEEELVVWTPEDGCGPDDVAAEREAFVSALRRIDEKIEAQPALRARTTQCTDGCLWVLRVPTFKPFTRVVECMAEMLPLARVLEISGHDEVQVRVTAGRGKIDETVRRLDGLPGCKVMFTFQLPLNSDAETSDQKHEISLCVQACFLLEVIRQCNDLGLKLFQVYDYWCG